MGLLLLQEGGTLLLREGGKLSIGLLKSFISFEELGWVLWLLFPASVWFTLLLRRRREVLRNVNT